MWEVGVSVSPPNKFCYLNKKKYSIFYINYIGKMALNKPNKIDMNSFLQNMNNPDEDYSVIELQNISNLLETYHELSILPQYEEFFINTIFQHLSSKKVELVEVIFRVIVLLAQYFSLEKLPLIFKQIVISAQERDSAMRPQLLSILKEILSNHVFYDATRNKKIYDSLFEIVKSDISKQSEDNLSFTIDLFTALLHNLGSLATQDELNETLDRILNFFSPNSGKQSQLRSIANLTKEWCKYSNDLSKLLNYLFDPTFQNSKTPLLILTSVASANPKALKSHINQLFDLFYQASLIGISNGEDIDNPEGSDDDLNNNDDDDLETDNGGGEMDAEKIKDVQSSMESLAILLQTFPVELKPYFEQLMHLFYNYVAYEIVDTDDQIEDEEIEMEIDEDMQNSDDMDDDETEVAFGSDSWKLRKAATRLGFALISTCSEEFITDLLQDHEKSITLALKDTDVGAKKDILDLMVKIVLTYLDKISPEIYQQWISLIASQAKPSDSNIVPTLNALSQLAQNVPVSSESIEIVLNSLIDGSITDKIAREVVSFLVSILRGECESLAFSTQIAILLTQIINFGNRKTSVQAMDTASILYSHAPISDEMVTLNKCISECYAKKGERKIHAITAFSIFVSKHYGKETSQESLNAIIESLSIDYAAKTALAGFILICSCAPDAIAPIAETVFPEIIKHIKASDQTLVFRALWSIYLITKNGLLNINEIAQYAKKIMITGVEADFRSRAVAYQILSIIAQSVDIYDQTVKYLLEKIRDEPLPKVALESCAEFLATIAMKAPEKMSQDLLITFNYCTGETNRKNPERSNQCVAYCIGKICSKCQSIHAQIIETIKNSIISADETSVLALLCYGEICSLTPIESSDELFQTILKYLNPEKPRAVFSASATAVGYIASGNASVLLPLVIQEAIEQESNFVIWLRSILSFSSRLLQNKVDPTTIIDSLNQTIDYLIKERDIKQETVQMISESLSNIAAVDKQFVPRLLSVATSGHKTLSPIASNAISLYFSITNEENISHFFNDVAQLVNPETPQIAAGALSAFKFAMRFPSYIPNVIERLSSIENCIEFNDSQIVRINTGLEDIKEDIGKAMRSSALDVLATIYKLQPNAINPEELVDASIVSIGDPDKDVSSRGLQFMTRLSLDDITKDIVAEKARIVSESFQKVHKPAEDLSQEIETPLYLAVAATRYATRSAPCLEIERVYARYKDSSLMTKAEEEIQSEISTRAAINSSESSFIIKSEAQILLKSINPEASAIYSN